MMTVLLVGRAVGAGLALSLTPISQNLWRALLTPEPLPPASIMASGKIYGSRVPVAPEPVPSLVSFTNSSRLPEPSTDTCSQFHEPLDIGRSNCVVPVIFNVLFRWTVYTIF